MVDGAANRLIHVGLFTFCGKSCAHLFCYHSSGGICLSPSLDHMAVTNLTSGIDFYDMLDGKFVTTTPFNPLAPTGCNRLVGIVYVNEDIVVAGHTNGDVVGVLTNDLEAPQMFKTNDTRNTTLRELPPSTHSDYH
jgi:hypothetical protein